MERPELGVNDLSWVHRVMRCAHTLSRKLTRTRRDPEAVIAWWVERHRRRLAASEAFTLAQRGIVDDSRLNTKAWRRFFGMRDGLANTAIGSCKSGYAQADRDNYQ